MALFITFEGPDGSGKTTQITLLAETLRSSGVPVLTTREPGGTRIGDGVRALLLDPELTEMNPRAETLLYCAARAQHVEQVIRPALAEGKVVLCDRYGDSTIAYQGYGHQQDVAALRLLVDYATGGLRPDLSLYFEIDVASGLRRKPAHALDRLEANAIAFHERVRAGYHQMVREDADRWFVIDAAQPIETVHAVLWQRVQALVAQREQILQQEQIAQREGEDG